MADDAESKMKAYAASQRSEIDAQVKAAIEHVTAPRPIGASRKSVFAAALRMGVTLTDNGSDGYGDHDWTAEVQAPGWVFGSTETHSVVNRGSMPEVWAGMAQDLSMGLVPCGMGPDCDGH